MVDYCFSEGGDQGLVVEAVESPSTLPLRSHAVHVSETSVVVTCEHPLRMVVGLVPNHLSHLYLERVLDLQGVGAPGRGQGTPPGLSDERVHSQEGSQAILEDAAIDFIVLEDGHYVIAQG